MIKAQRFVPGPNSPASTQSMDDERWQWRTALKDR
jgi:hypothetical protein